MYLKLFTIFAYFAVLLGAGTALSDPILLLSCDDLGEGDILSVQITQQMDGSLTLSEFFDDERVQLRGVSAEEMEKNHFELSEYHSYSRTLKKNAKQEWVVVWGCGQTFEASCTEPK